MLPALLMRTRSRPYPELADVVVPLEEAYLHSHSYRSKRRGRTEREQQSDTHYTADMSCQGTPDKDDDEGNGDYCDGLDQVEDTAGMLAIVDTSRPYEEYSIEGLREAVRGGRGGGARSVYEMKSRLINKAIQDIGMGRYNWQLFVLCGFGWFADNLWMQGVSLTLPSLSAEFGISEKSVRYTTSSLFIGLCFGSFFWGIGSDIMGRRIAFNATLLIASIFGTVSAWAATWGGVCFMYAVLGFGVGGNLPVDGALFLEFLPDASSSLLTLLSIWWPIGQLCSSLFAWYFIANWPAYKGWRYFVCAIGLITFAMFLVRFAIFQMLESPKFLLSQGRQSEAVAVVQGLAARNGRKTWLTEDILNEVMGDDDDEPVPMTTTPRRRQQRPTISHLVRTRLASFSANRIRPLFNTRKLAITTSLIWFCWATIGMGYPLFNAFLPQYFSHGSQPTDPSSTVPQLPPSTYRNYAITSLAGIPGSLIAAYAVEMRSPLLGRRGTLALSTFVSAVFLFLFVRLGTRSPTVQLIFSCIEAFAQNIMYGVLYAFTPEIFPAPVRGAGTGVASFLNRVMGLMAPIIAATVPGDGTTAPVYLSAGLILAAAVSVCAVPIETRGRQRL